MGPYLAVISDSFVEAFKSRVLWILILGWTLLLAALAPFGWIEGDDFVIRSESITSRDRLLSDLQKVAKGEGTDAQKRVWNALEPDFKSRVDKLNKNPGMFMNQGRLADGISTALDSADLYDQQAWPTAANRADIKELLNDYQLGKLKGDKLTLVNRKLIELAFPNGIRSNGRGSVWFGYAGIKLSAPLPLSREQMRPYIDGILLFVLKIAIGVVGIFISIIVTSNLIPDMFAPGSMALLLSRPISRSGLLLAKYFGGVCFILINVSYLIVGFYLLLGSRLGVWNPGLIWCIPLFIFVFMIFYSVSTLIGLIWKNAIVSIVFVVLFWSVCFVLGLANLYLHLEGVESPQITKLLTCNGHLVGANRKGELLIWDRTADQWKQVGGAVGPERIVGPLWLPSKNMVLFGRAHWAPFYGLQTDGTRLQSINFGDEIGEIGAESVKKNDLPLWSEKRLDSLVELPSSTRRLKVVNDQVIAATESGFFRYDVDVAKNKTEPTKLFGIFQLPNYEEQTANQKLTSDDTYFEGPLDFCELPDSHDLLIISKSTLQRYRWSDQNSHLEMVQELKLEIADGALSLIAANEQECFVFTNQKQVLRVDLTSWTYNKNLNIELQALRPKELYPYKDRDFLLLTTDGQVVIIKDQGQTFEFPPQPSRVTAIAVGNDQDIYYAAIGNEIRKLSDGQSQLSLAANPRWSKSQWVYWTLVHPVYLIFPKPAAVDNLIYWALAQPDSAVAGTQTEEMEQTDEESDLWTPIWSNTAFIVVVMAISCIYLGRQDT